MKIIEKQNNLTICYDFEEKKLSFNVLNVDGTKQTQINISNKEIDKLRIILQYIPNENL